MDDSGCDFIHKCHDEALRGVDMLNNFIANSWPIAAAIHFITDRSTGQSFSMRTGIPFSYPPPCTSFHDFLLWRVDILKHENALECNYSSLSNQETTIQTTYKETLNKQHTRRSSLVTSRDPRIWDPILRGPSLSNRHRAVQYHAANDAVPRYNNSASACTTAVVLIRG